MFVILGQSEGTAFKNRHDSFRKCMASRTFSRINVCEHSLLCHPQMQIKVVSCKEKAISEHPEMNSEIPFGKNGQKMDTTGSSQTERNGKDNPGLLINSELMSDQNRTFKPLPTFLRHVSAIK